ncbi:hypothetical protein GCM10009863_25970 [Streptomyces axinellae]|uniref:Hydrolase n=2 Tax=Streptomyces axinellae TaxID=552788 RepID=A0ABN3Q0D6_9ACTN
MGVVSEHVHGHGLAICANGAAVVDLHAEGRRIVRVRELARADALAVVHALREAAPGVTFAVERTEGIHYEPDYPFFPHDPGTSYAPADELLAEGAGAGTRPGPGTRPGTGTETGAATGPGDADPVLKLLAHHPGMDPDDFLALGRKTAGPHAEFTRSSPSALLEISGRGVSKASTLALACAERGIAPEEVVAFGDMPNDLEMLAWAGTSYAMANGHPDVRVSTTHTTSSNEEDGVATVIETYV